MDFFLVFVARSLPKSVPLNLKIDNDLLGFVFSSYLFDL